MITANELRVGNRYHRKHGKGWTDVIIDENMMGLIFGDSLDYALDDFEPIILTDEIFLRFGFFKTGDAYCLDFNQDDGLRVWIHGIGNVTYHIGRISCNINSPQIKYLHQLQLLVLSRSQGLELQDKMAP